jgi:hypothetical protein
VYTTLAIAVLAVAIVVPVCSDDRGNELHHHVCSLATWRIVLTDSDQQHKQETLHYTMLDSESALTDTIKCLHHCYITHTNPYCRMSQAEPLPTAVAVAAAQAAELAAREKALAALVRTYFDSAAVTVNTRQPISRWSAA